MFWLEHTGKDVYCGMVGLSDHQSYHETGKRHIKQAGNYQILETREQLKELHGIVSLTTLAFAKGLLDAGSYLREYYGGSSDAVVYLDTRSMPAGEPVNVMLGLLEVGRSDLLPLKWPNWTVHQVTLVTAVTPWVWISVGWPKA